MGTRKTDDRLVLLVEDNSDDERLTLRTLRKNNVMNEIIVACTGEDAITMLEQSLRRGSGLPSLILLDLRLPGLTGLEVVRWIRSQNSLSTVPAVVFTTSTHPDDVLACSLAGANSYVVKPTDPLEFSEVLLNIALYWLLLHETANGNLNLSMA